MDAFMVQVLCPGCEKTHKRELERVSKNGTPSEDFRLFSNFLKSLSVEACLHEVKARTFIVSDVIENTSQ